MYITNNGNILTRHIPLTVCQPLIRTRKHCKREACIWRAVARRRFALCLPVALVPVSAQGAKVRVRLASGRERAEKLSPKSAALSLSGVKVWLAAVCNAPCV